MAGHTWLLRKASIALIGESAETVRVFLEAEDLAARTGQSLGSAHVLLAFFTFANRAHLVLTDHGVDEEKILTHIHILEEESRLTVVRLRRKAHDMALGGGAHQVGSLHVLMALIRLRSTFAYRLLARSAAPLSSLRQAAGSIEANPLPPRRYPNRPPIEAQLLSCILGRGAHPLPRCSYPLGTRHELPVALAAQPCLPRHQTQYRREITTSATATTLPATAEKHAERRLNAEMGHASIHELACLRQPSQAAARLAAHRAFNAHLADMAPTLASFGIDLTDRARRGQLDAVVGRDHELQLLIDILGKRRANNPILVGGPGVGKTAIAEGLAVKIARRDADVAHFHDRYVVALDTAALLAGTSLRGSFSERLCGIKTEVAAAGGQIIVFLDELHTIIGAGSSGEGAQDAANELKTALARGDFPCIGATTTEEYTKYIERDAALERRFTPIFVEEPTPEQAMVMMQGAATAYSSHHSVRYSSDALSAAVELTHRFIADRCLPDKAFTAIDLAGSRARRQGKQVVERVDVAGVVHELSGVPLSRLADADSSRISHAEAMMRQKIVGQDAAIAAVCRCLRRGFAGFNRQRPLASMLFLGPTGVGKTHMVKILAEFLFGRRDAIVRVDMNELTEKHAIARLIGAQPGYVGYEEGGQLTEALRKRPFQIVLFDGIDKAHPDVLNLLLQILDEGCITDSRGRHVRFSQAVVVLTANLTTTQSSDADLHTVGFAPAHVDEADEGALPPPTSAHKQEAMLALARSRIAPELWSRLDEKLLFAVLKRPQVRRIAQLELQESCDALERERGICVTWNDAVLDTLLDCGGYHARSGARGIRQTIQRFVEVPIAEKILNGELTRGQHITIITTANGGLALI